MSERLRALLDDGSLIAVSDIIDKGEIHTKGLVSSQAVDVVVGGSVDWLIGEPSEGHLRGVTMSGGYPHSVHLPDVREGVAHSGNCCDLNIDGDYYLAELSLRHEA